MTFTPIMQLSGYFRQARPVPEPPLNPPEADDVTYERNLTMSIIDDCRSALAILRDRLEEIEFALTPDTTIAEVERYLGEREDG